MSGRGRCDARVLQVQQISQIVAPVLHPKSLIINVCSTVAGEVGGYRIPVTSAVRCATSLRLDAPIWCRRRLLMKLYSSENSEEPVGVSPFPDLSINCGLSAIAHGPLIN